MRHALRVGLAVAFVAGLLATEGWLAFQLEAAAKPAAGHARWFDRLPSAGPS